MDYEYLNVWGGDSVAKSCRSSWLQQGHGYREDVPFHVTKKQISREEEGLLCIVVGPMTSYVDLYQANPGRILDQTEPFPSLLGLKSGQTGPTGH